MVKKTKSKIVLYGYKQFDCIHKLDNIHKGIAEDVKTTFDTSNYELECNSIQRSLSKGKNEKVIGLMKDELEEKK